MQIRITSQKTGEQAAISRSVTTTHPQWVHDQLGTGSESELQRALDQLNVGGWYDADGKHLGPDCCGLEMFADRAERASALGRSLEAGDNLSYQMVNDMGDMVTEELVATLRRRGLRMSREDTDCIWIEAIGAE